MPTSLQDSRWVMRPEAEPVMPAMPAVAPPAMRASVAAISVTAHVNATAAM